MSNQTRREFLKTGVLSTFLLGSGITLAGGCDAIRQRGKTKNIIFMVSDGMSAGTLQMADTYLRRTEGRPSHWIRLLEENVLKGGLMDMASADRIVTDSAAAAASWGCGYRVNNGALNIGPDGTHHATLQKVFKDADTPTGLVTTTEITHATPAGFAANVEHRSQGEDIALQYYERGVDLLLGGAHNHLAGDTREDGRDLYADFEQAGYTIARNKAELLNGSAEEGRLLGIFANGHLPYTLDQVNTPDLLESVPTLAEMTDVAIRNLSKNPNGFLLQVEGGRVDHGAHGNDVGAMLFDQIAFDNAIEVAMNFAQQRDDTLVIITTDHGNANPGFSSAPDSQFDNLQNFRYTNTWIRRELNTESSISEIRERIEYATGYEVPREEAEDFLASMKGEYRATYARRSGASAILGQVIANYTDVNFVGGSHTADYVELASFGPGSEAINGFVRNTQLFDVITQSAGVLGSVEGELTA